MAKPLSIVFFGSGEFGRPTLERLVADSALAKVALVVSQPDRPAGRKRKLTPTPIASWAEGTGLPTLKPEKANDPEAMQRIHEIEADAFVVIAFGQKLGPDLLGKTFAINLHGSLLPKYRGAAPVNWAMIHGEAASGVSVITLAQRMDAGDILATAETKIRPDETAGALHDRLAALGPDLVAGVLDAFANDAVKRVAQDDTLASRAPKLKKTDGTVDFNLPADAIRARIHGLNPWPGCTVMLNNHAIKLGLVRAHPDHPHDSIPGTILEQRGFVACANGAIEILRLQAPGGRMIDLAKYLNGHELLTGGRFGG